MPGEEEPRVFTADETQEDISLELDALRNRILQVMRSEWRVGLSSLRS